MRGRGDGEVTLREPKNPGEAGIVKMHCLACVQFSMTTFQKNLFLKNLLVFIIYVWVLCL